MGELAGSTKTWAGSAVQPCTAPAHLCTSTSLHTHSSAHTSAHIHSHTPVDTCALRPATHLCTQACLYTHSHVSTHPRTLVHILNLTPVSLHTHVPMRAHPPIHTHPCAHLHTLTLSILPLGPSAIPFILWLLRITMPAGEEAELPPDLQVSAAGVQVLGKHSLPAGCIHGTCSDPQSWDLTLSPKYLSKQEGAGR